MKKFLLGLLVVTVLASSSMASSPSTHITVPLSLPKLEVYEDVTFAQVFTWPESRLKMDIIRPESTSKLPAVVFVTGGGFIAAPKSRYLQQRVRIAEAGYAVASIEYRVIPNGRALDAVKDVKSAIRYLRAHAGTFNIDPDKIAVMGDSAGGYMAAMAGTSNGVKDFDEGEYLDFSSDVSAAIDVYGLSDLTRIADDFAPEVQEIYTHSGSSPAVYVNGLPPFGEGGSILSTPEKANAANPLTYISSRSAPFLLMHGDKDTLVSPSQTELLHDALTEAGIESTRYVIDGAGHGDHYWYQPEILEIIIDFLNKHLK